MIVAEESAESLSPHHDAVVVLGAARSGLNQQVADALLRPLVIVEGDVLADEMTQVPLVEQDDVVEALAANRADELRRNSAHVRCVSRSGAGGMPASLRTRATVDSATPMRRWRMAPTMVPKLQPRLSLAKRRMAARLVWEMRGRPGRRFAELS